VSIFSCRDTVRLLTQTLDHDLALPQRLAMRVHLLGCPQCSRFRQQLLFMHRAAQAFEEKRLQHPENNSPALSPEARQRMQRALEHENP
jgi:hypothetical protein